ncbi:MAG: EsaB/YukD family protein [Clostridiales bacterium]|nr:EsaB/YukD family protein [Clostridiales bacterium]MDD6935975.1 EsaB/YukD family protein [Clostridiales bacterium]MDY2962256.1 EsaB/YukD family protein [Oscillospiraceae bacterium]
MEEKAIVILHLLKRNLEVDLEIPLNITANDLVVALNSAYQLGINTENVMECYVKCENPIALLRGNKTLADFGVRNGSDLYITE